MNNLKKTLVWDMPTRLFHWMLVGGFLIAAFIAFILGDDSRLFPYHAIAGLSMTLMVLMRILWGFVGSRYARFSSFTFGARAVIEYITGEIKGSGTHHIGHNPGAAWAIFAMLILLPGLATTGLFMHRAEFIKEIHEFFANVMAMVVVLHILGVLFHVVRHGENIVASMFHGHKNAEEQFRITSSHPIVAVIFLVICASWGVGLLANYDKATQTTHLPIIGLSVQLGEVEDEKE